MHKTANNQLEAYCPVQEPPQPAATEVEPAPEKAQDALAEPNSLRRHVALRKVLAVASLAGLAYLARGASSR